MSTLGHVESFLRPPYNNDIMRWGEKYKSPRSYFISPQLAMFTVVARFGRVIELAAVYYLIIFSPKNAEGACGSAIRCFSLSPHRNMIEFSCALSRRTLPPARKAANCFRTRKIPTKDAGGRGFLADLGVSQTLRMSGVQDAPRKKKPIGESSQTMDCAVIG